jgi:hypothetical protein
MDLMERLAAADPVREDEAPGPEAEALLARLTTTPVEPRRRPRRRPLVAVAAGVAVAAAAFVALNPGGAGVDQAIAAKVVAALTRGDSVYHLLQRKETIGDSLGGPEGPFLEESWYASDGRRHEKYFADDNGRRGRALEESAGTRVPGHEGAQLRWVAEQNEIFYDGLPPTSGTGKLPALDPTGDPAATLRALQARGALKVDGETADGYRLVSDPIEDESGTYRFEYIVDKTTYLPRSQRWTLTRGSQTLGLKIDYLSYERLPLGAKAGAQLRFGKHPRAKCSAEANQPSDEMLGFPNPCR